MNGCGYLASSGCRKGKFIFCFCSKQHQLPHPGGHTKKLWHHPRLIPLTCFSYPCVTKSCWFYLQNCSAICSSLSQTTHRAGSDGVMVAKLAFPMTCVLPHRVLSLLHPTGRVIVMAYSSARATAHSVCVSNSISAVLHDNVSVSDRPHMTVVP